MGTLKNTERLAGVHADLARVIRVAAGKLDFDLIIVEGMRTLAKQREYVAKGASQTLKSRHLTGHAVDIAPYIAGEVRWDWPLYRKIAVVVKQTAKDLGIKIEWGGDWKDFKDGPHWQLPWKEYPALRAHSLTDEPVPDLDAAPAPNEEPKKEPTATQTGIFKGATISGGAVTVAGVAEIAKSVNEVKDAASSWVNYALPIAIGVALLAIAYIIYDHWQERKNAGHQ